MLDRLGRF